MNFNFPLILFVLCIITGILWTLDKLVFSKKRAAGAPQPVWVEYGASFFPIILVVFGLRSFVIEPFKIPSGSMKPTLLIGDFIAVNKFTYGIRLPIINTKIIPINDPQRGDVMVFRYPVDPSKDYIKRVVGLPGDKISYQSKVLYVNGQVVQRVTDGDFLDEERQYSIPRYKEQLGKVNHTILIDDAVSGYFDPITKFPNFDNCDYNSEGVSCTVPAGHYFMMGDNRDNSQDSRYWGFVPEENIVGKAVYIWFNFNSLKRIGGFN